MVCETTRFLYIRLLISHEFNTSLEGDPIGISECSLVLRKLKCLRYMAMLQYISLSWHNTEAWQRHTDRQVDVLRQCSFLMWSQKIVFSGNNVYNSKHTTSSVFSEPFTSTFRFFADETSYKKNKDSHLSVQYFPIIKSVKVSWWCMVQCSRQRPNLYI